MTSNGEKRIKERPLARLCYSMVLLTALAYAVVNTGKEPTQLYGVVLLLLFLVLFALERMGRIRYITVARILVLPLLAPIMFWTVDGAGLKISGFAVLWHMVVALVPIFAYGELNRSEVE